MMGRKTAVSMTDCGEDEGDEERAVNVALCSGSDGIEVSQQRLV